MKKTLSDFQNMKTKGEKVSWITAYNYWQGTAAERANIDFILVGDSGTMVELGKKDTTTATLEEMIILTAAVRRGAPNTAICADFPIHTYDNSEQAVETAIRFVNECQADFIKLEGRKIREVEAINNLGINSIGHLGLIPQSSNGFKVYGKTLESFEQIIEDAKDLQNAGIKILLIEAVPEVVGEQLVKNLSIPVFGIGAGAKVDGNLTILSDTLGLYPNFRPSFVKCYTPFAVHEFNCSLRDVLAQDLKQYGKDTPGADGMLKIAEMAISMYHKDVKDGIFPSEPYNYKIKPEELEVLKTSKYWKE